MQRAQTLVEEIGARSYVPFIAEARAELAKMSGNDEEGRRLLNEAHQLFGEMGATGQAARLAALLEDAAN